MPKPRLKSIVQGMLFGRWRRARPIGPGYTILMPMPMDMPFLLRFALEGVRSIDTTHCKQIVVIPDGFGSDGGESMKQVIREVNDPRVEFTRVSRIRHHYIHQIQKRRSNNTAAIWSHWAMIVAGVDCSVCEHAFLHDADAFFVDADALERQYVECRDRGMYTLGVQYRLDAFFNRIGYSIPGTWEMMFSVPWARSRRATFLRGQYQDTPQGGQVFDTMLYPQYLDFPSGKIGAMAAPPRHVHFHGTIMTFRNYRDRQGKSVGDDLFRLLLLSILEDLVPSKSADRVMPTPSEMARGLTDTSAPVTYGSTTARREYPRFRREIEELCQAPTFVGERAARIREFLHPFDEHFASHEPDAESRDESVPMTPRLHGLS